MFFGRVYIDISYTHDLLTLYQALVLLIYPGIRFVDPQSVDQQR